MFSTYVPTRLEIGELISKFFPATPETAGATLLLTIVLFYAIGFKVLTYISYISDPARDLPGPKSLNWLTGSIPRGIWEPDAQEKQLEWTRVYGPVFRYYGFPMVCVILFYVTDANYCVTCVPQTN